MCGVRDWMTGGEGAVVGLFRSYLGVPASGPAGLVGRGVALCGAEGKGRVRAWPGERSLGQMMTVIRRVLRNGVLG